MHTTIQILSKREQEVAKQITMGKTNRDIGDSLYISERTVKFHCANIYKKLKITNRSTLISLRRSNPLITLIQIIHKSCMRIVHYRFT